MAVSVRVYGTKELDAKANALLVEARRFQRRISTATRGAVDRVYRPALMTALPEFMPDRYAGVLGSDLHVATSVRFAGSNPGVHVTLTAPTGGPKGRAIHALEYAANLRHPLFGNKRFWYDQRIKRSFASKTAKGIQPELVQEIDAELAKIKREVEGA